ncbi:MAG: T9SS type A sorting domain-containing protein [Parabacteroides sp.]
MRGLYGILVGLALTAMAPLFAQTGRAGEVMHSTQQVVTPSNEVSITATENRIVVENAPVGSKLEIYSVVGIKVKEIDMKTPSGEYVVNIAKGYYIIRIGETVRKIAIR